MSVAECKLCESLKKPLSFQADAGESKAAHAELHFDQMRAIISGTTSPDSIYARCFLEDIDRPTNRYSKAVLATWKRKRVSIGDAKNREAEYIGCTNIWLWA